MNNDNNKDKDKESRLNEEEYKGWGIFSHLNDGKWDSNVTTRNSTGELSISTSYPVSITNKDTIEEAVTFCKNYIDTELPYLTLLS